MCAATTGGHGHEWSSTVVTGANSRRTRFPWSSSSAWDQSASQSAQPLLLPRPLDPAHHIYPVTLPPDDPLNPSGRLVRAGVPPSLVDALGLATKPPSVISGLNASDVVVAIERDNVVLQALPGDHDAGDPLPLINRPLQIALVSIIMAAALFINICVILNIGRNELKLRTVNFLLIQNLCIVDCVGAALVLPVPLAVITAGKWNFGSKFCTATSVVTVALWGQHLLVVIMLKVDRVLAACLPIGRYPLLRIELVMALVVLTWLVSFACAGLVTYCFGAVFEPAIILCIPDLPVAFFLVIFTGYCAGLVGLTVAYILVMVSLRKKQARVHNITNVRLLDYRRLEKSALTSFLITISHFLLYLPAMLVVGLRGWVLHPVAILICDLVVYCEFLVHPVVLLLTSAKLRGEVVTALRRVVYNLLA